MKILDCEFNKLKFYWIIIKYKCVTTADLDTWVNTWMMFYCLAHARTHTFVYASIVNTNIWCRREAGKLLSKTYYAFTKSYFKIIFKADFGILKLFILYVWHSREHKLLPNCQILIKFSVVLTILPSIFLNVLPFIHTRTCIFFT